jgi:hypothetical protein
MVKGMRSRLFGTTIAKKKYFCVQAALRGRQTAQLLDNKGKKNLPHDDVQLLAGTSGESGRNPSYGYGCGG